ncbi:ribonuclease P protein component [Legionella sp. CNM-4043-24]|uniref:ribonuclease P protein component n=1 Tax=Legionella sp. CNM-4043-24 TaxID=3421646 RepID=UPI00403ACE8A
MFCFTKAQRLLKKSEYDYVFAKANKVLTPEFIILHRDNSLGYARLGLALSKKMVARSNQRNRLKRLIRESFRTHSLPAMDFIFLARQGAAKVENKLIIANLSKIWARLTNSSVS